MSERGPGFCTPASRSDVACSAQREIIGSSPALLAALRKVAIVAPTDVTVLISGETGTGKELIARALHAQSLRRDRALISLNCNAIAAGLMESELFGHVKGAFTGAAEHRAGRFQAADGGTLFLDEVSGLSLEAQAKLLRVLQEHEFEAVGSSKTVTVDVRVIAATNRELAPEVQAGRFRADLFYRLNVFPIDVPPLRERGNDVVTLAATFAARVAKRMGRTVELLSQDDIARLRAYPWPGNIRELQNVIERAVITSSDGQLGLARFLQVGSSLAAPTGPEHTRGVIRTIRDLEQIERDSIVAALEAAGGRVAGADGAAERLGTKPSTLRSRMKALGIGRTD